MRLTRTTSGSKPYKTPKQYIFSGERDDDFTANPSTSIKKLMRLANEADDAPCDNLYDIFLAQTLNLISLSPTGRALIREAADQNWSLAMVCLSESDFSIDIAAKQIELDHHGLRPEGLMRSAYFGSMALISLISALRDVWHEKRHGDFNALFSPEAILMLERVRAADCDVLSMLTAWELRCEGYTDIWRHMLGSENGDLAVVYANHIEYDPASQFNGKALKASFMQWYSAHERINECDHITLEYLDDVLQNADVKNPFGRKIPTHIGIELLSCLPDKSAYLQGFGGEILMDPKYSGLSDPVNQAHLMHILYDLEATVVNNVPFRDAKLAAKIFPLERDQDSDILADL